MQPLERQILEHFKELVSARLPLHQMILFGSRARGDADPDSDMDVLVVMEGEAGKDEWETVNRCAWEAGFEHGIVVAPVIYGRTEWEEGPERYSLLAKAVEQDGVCLIEREKVVVVNDSDPDELVQHRLEDAREALSDARFLRNAERSPESIIDRSYYAMFYAALALLQKTGHVPAKRSGVLTLFDTEFQQKGLFPHELSMYFHQAFELHNNANYEFDKRPTMEDAGGLIQKAELFVEALNNYLAH